MAWSIPVFIASAVTVLIGAPLWLLHRQRRRLVGMAEERRRRAEVAGQAARRELAQLREGLADGLLVAELDGLVLANVNQALCRMLGYSRGDLISAGLETILAPTARQRIKNACQALADGQAFSAAEIPCLRADGGVSHLDLSARRVGMDGRPRLLATFRTAEDRLAAQRELRQSQELYRSLVECTSDGYFIAELPSGRFVHLNRRIREIFGYPPDAGLAHSIWDILAPEEHPRARQRHDELKSQDPALAGPAIYTGLRQDGTRLVMEVCSTLATYCGQPALQGLVRDVTERESLERQLRHAQKMQAIGTLAGGVAHEFNNLLMALGGYLQLLREKLDGQDDALTYAAKMDQTCQRAAGLTRQMLTLSRLEPRRRQAVEPNQVVREVHDLLRQTLPPSIGLACELAPDLPPVMANPGQIQQVLLNLGLNARDALPEGGLIRFATRLAPGPDPDDPAGAPRVILEVRDSGQGMSAEVLERLFEPFFTTKEAGRGTGLGLSIVYSLVRGLGGGIAVSSRPGQGSAFTVTLPASHQPASPEARAGQAPAKRPGGRRGQGELVMVVDDEISVGEVLNRILTHQGYQVLEARNGQEALEILQRLRDQGRAPDLMLLDLAMPVMDGAELMRRLAADQARFPVLVVTGQELPLPPEAAGQVRAVLEKPFDLGDLLDQVRLALEAETSAAQSRQPA